MSKTNIIIFAMLFTGVVILIGCKTSAESEPVSFSPKIQPSPRVQEVKGSMNNVKKSEAGNEVKISYSLAHAQLSLHQPIILNFTVENGLAETINVDLGRDRKQEFLFAVTLPDGRKKQLPQLWRDGISRIGKLSIEPQQTYTQKLLLNEWYEFDSLGIYELEVRLATDVYSSDGKIVARNSGFRIEIEIEPRNPERLEQMSAMLSQQIVESKTAQEAAEAALALSYVKDEVAVPYLEKVLNSNKMVEPIIISGLARVGNESAVQALLKTLKKKPDSEVAALSKGALTKIKNQTSDLKLKETVEQSLKN